MVSIDKVTQKTQNKFVNLYDLDVTHKNGRASHYYVASRAKTEDELKIRTGENHPDGVIIYCVYGPDRDKVVLVRQYRYTIGDFVYEFPAGLVERGEDYRGAAVREMHEETGLNFRPLDVDPMFEEPRFTTVGLTDESCATVYGYAEGEISDKYLEESEVLEIVLADRDEIRRILKEEKVAIMCAYHLMHFLVDEEPFKFLGE
ncbi:MAG TPA: NUDIX hydrolase [Lachnospiraceae bacterium]|nr:NUDIX hydrolase [Lachnospiraceae bacterium]